MGNGQDNTNNTNNPNNTNNNTNPNKDESQERNKGNDPVRTSEIVRWFHGNGCDYHRYRVCDKPAVVTSTSV